jgi:large conductance mechanosensitive channel
MLKEFKEFALKGNMVDMAVGIVIGAAFATVVGSLVDDIIMPLVAAIFQAPDFSNLFITLRNPSGEVFSSIEAAREAGAVALGYGLFINALIAFLIVAIALFLVIRSMNRLMAMKAKEAAAPATPPAPTPQEVLLAEIRDLLKVQTGPASGAV